MITYLKQLFCNHSYETKRKESLGYGAQKDNFGKVSYLKYALHKTCSKCGKKTIEIRRRINKVHFKNNKRLRLDGKI